MHHKIFLLFQYFFIIVIIPLQLQAQSSRAPSASEAAAIQKTINVVTPFIDGFANNDWEKAEGGADDMQNISVQKNPDVVMGVAPFNVWHFRVKGGSDYFNRVIKPLQDKIPESDLSNATTEKLNEYLKIGQQLKKLTDIYVEVNVNVKNLPDKILKGTPANLNIAGTAYAYKEKAETEIPTIRDGINSYILAFGNWSTATLDKNLNVYQYQFTHKPGLPYIENIVIKISGNEERIHQLFKTANWKEVNNALTN